LLKDYVIKDNAIQKNLDKLLQLSNEVPFYFSEDFRGRIKDPRVVEGDDRPPGGWTGFRSQCLMDIDREFYEQICNEILSNILAPTQIVECEMFCYFHILPKVDQLIQYWIHKDDDGVIAGVIYLTEEPKPDSGTQISLDDGMKVSIQNKFNRLISYRSDLYHCAEGGFGTDLNDSRKTLVFFIKNMKYMTNK